MNDWHDAWWAEPFDLKELRDRGFTYEEVRELERLREEAIPPEIKKENRDRIEAAIARVNAIFDALRQAMLDDSDDD